jgi:hypothetical protein
VTSSLLLIDGSSGESPLRLAGAKPVGLREAAVELLQ